MKKIFNFILLIFGIVFLVGCDTVPNNNNNNNNNQNDTKSLTILNSEVIYFDELIDGKLELELDIKGASDDSIIVLVDQEKNYVDILDNKYLVIDESVTKNYIIVVTVVLEETRSVYDSKNFIINQTRGVVIGSNQISQVVVTANGNPMHSRGISWFTSEDIDDSDVLVSLNANFTTYDVYKGAINVFDSYVEGSDYDNRIPKITFYNHQAIINNLTPGTTYYYKVGSLTKNLFSKVGSFKTTTADEKITLFLSTDVHVGSNELPIKGNRFYHAAVSDAITRYGIPDFLVSTGDFVTQWYGHYKYFEWEWAYAMNLTPYFRDTTFVPVSGNHDNYEPKVEFDYAIVNHYSLPESPLEINDGQIKGPNYTFEAGNALIMVINHIERGNITQKQLTWIENELKNTDKEWKIVFSHIGLPTSVHGLLEEYGVVLAYSGHEHYYRRSKPLVNGVPTAYSFDDNPNYLVNPTGVTYVTNSTTGGANSWRDYSTDNNDFDGFGLGSSLSGLGTIQHRWGMYSIIEIENDKITVNIYIRNTTKSDGAFTLYSTYGFIRK